MDRITFDLDERGNPGGIFPQRLLTPTCHERIVEAEDLYFVSYPLFDPPGELATRHASGVEAEHEPTRLSVPLFHDSRSLDSLLSRG
jgi:hypothetical protein